MTESQVSIFDPPKDGMKGRVAGAMAITGVAQAVRLGSQILSVVVISRLLTPHAFGVMAMVSPLLTFMGTLQELGLAQAAIQRPVLTQRQASSLFWVNAAAGAFFSVVLALIAPLVGMFYMEPGAGQVLLASAPLALVIGVGVQHRSLLTRQMQFRKLMIRDTASIVLGFAAGVVTALIWKNYWALFAANAITVISGTAGAMIGTRWRPSAPARDPELRKMMNFGAGVTGFTIANFFARNMDSMLIGKFFGGSALGLYDRGLKLMLFPLTQGNNALLQVMSPSLSSLLGEPARYRNGYLRSIGLVMLFTMPGTLMLGVTADWFIPLVLGDRWIGVVPIFRWLAVTGLVLPYISSMNWLLMTQGRTKQLAQWGLASAIIRTVAFVAGMPWGAAGVAMGFGLSELLVRAPGGSWFAAREGPVRTQDLARLWLPYGAASLASFLALSLLCRLWSPPPLLGLIVATPLSYAVFAAVLLLFPIGRTLADEGRQLANWMNRRLLRLRGQAAPSVSGEP
jgi:PST family polysaccharide transporter